MNKKLFILPILLVAILSGCNLYLEEEEPVAEELKGYDKAEHLVNDTVDVTYQFQPNTRSITGSILDYLVRVEADTILYFLDNTPIDYLPVTGGYVFAEISDKLPWGLMSYVEWAGYDNGFYKVVTTFNGVALNDVFQVFEMEVNKPLDYSKGSTVPLPDSLYNPDDYVPVTYNPDADILEPVDEEYTLVQDENGHEDYIPAWAANAPKRAEDKDDPTGDEDTESKNNLCFFFDSRNITDDAETLEKFCTITKCPLWLSKVLGINKGKSKVVLGNKFNDKVSFMKGWYWAISLKRESKEIIHSKISLSNKIIEWWKDNTVTWTFIGEAGYGADLKAKVFEVNKPYDISKKAKEIISKLSKKERRDGNANVDMVVEPSEGLQVPIWGPVYLVFRTSLTFDFTFNLCGQFGFTSTETSRQGFSYENGKKNEIKEESSSMSGHAAIMGNAELKGEFFIGGGLGIGKAGVSCDFTVGPTFTAGINASVGVDFLSDDPWQLDLANKTKLEGYITCAIVGHLKAHALFKEVLDIPIKFKEWDIKRTEWRIYPKIDSKSIKVTKTTDDWDFSDGKQDFKMQYKYDGVGLLGKVTKYYPAIDLYESKRGTFVDRYYPDEYFDYDTNGYIDQAIPILWTKDKLYDDVMRDLSSRAWFTSASPCVSSVAYEHGPGLRQIYAHEPYSSGGKMRVIYVAFGCYLVEGASKIKRWGLKLTLKNKDGKKVGKSQEIEVGDCKSKAYNIRLNVATTCRDKVTLEAQPWADVIDQKGDKHRTYYDKETATLVEGYKATYEDLLDYNKYDWQLNPTGY